MVYTSDYNTAYSAMIKRHEKIIFSVCFFYATTATPFEDLRQEVLISLFKAYRHFRLESAESTWVYKVCINTCPTPSAGHNIANRCGIAADCAV